ncbi:MAG: sugar ABC transporter substrate-binding protein [Acidobacteriota bacterium]
MRLRAGSLVLALGFLAGCADGRDRPLQFWGLGREGEEAPKILPAHVISQQIPWSAAHEKILTAFVGNSAPDIGQVGNTWIPELSAIGAIEPLDEYLKNSKAVLANDYFPGIWDTNVMDGHVWGIPWYVDTRLLFYRRDLLEEVGFKEAPRTWSGWMEAMSRLERRAGPKGFAILLPTDEWQPPIAMALQKGAPLLRDHDRWAVFREPRFVSAYETYRDIYRRGYASVVPNSQVGNLYQQFAQGTFAMYVTGPWNLGEMRNRLPPEMQDRWATAPMPAPDGDPWPGASVAGGASLVLFRSSERKAEAWQVIEHLSRPEQQVRLFRLTGDLPARKSAWTTPELSRDPQARAFWQQLQNVKPTPKVPEWEQIATLFFEHSELAIRGRATTDQALRALEADVNRLLEKRRWLMDQKENRE